MKKKSLSVFIISLTLTGILLPAPAQAQGLPFGGIVSFPITCTCSPALWVWFTPLYLGGPIVITGPVVYSSFTTTLYANFMIGVPSKWHLGSYLPGVQACWMSAAIACFPLPAVGLMTKVGTN